MYSFRTHGLHVLLYVMLVLHVQSHEHGSSEGNAVKGKRWAVLIAGSNGYGNYRHQADVCHAYQILKRGGLKDENIVVFMYDDIAFAPENPRPGVIINRPDGEDVYQGVPKDYTGDEVNVNNFLNVIMGNRSGVTGGSGKVVDSGPDDNIFIYYTDHGAPGLLGMPDGELYAKDFIDTLEKKHKLKSYKNMVIYIEACESGSMFEGLLRPDLNIYAVTASNGTEGSWAIYCTGFYPKSAPQYDTCLGDVFSVSWLEDSELHDRSKETLKKQYEVVKRRTGFDQAQTSSHVMQFGTKNIQNDYLMYYIGNDPSISNSSPLTSSLRPKLRSVNQRDAYLFYLKQKIFRAPKGSPEKAKAKKKYLEEIKHRKKIDQSITKILHLAGQEHDVSKIRMSTRARGQPIVHNWDCYKTVLTAYKKYCRASVRCGLHDADVFAYLCNMGLKAEQVVAHIKQVCRG